MWLTIKALIIRVHKAQEQHDKITKQEVFVPAQLSKAYARVVGTKAALLDILRSESADLRLAWE